MILLNVLLTLMIWNVLSSIFYLKNNKKPKILYCGLIGYSGEVPYNLDKIKILFMFNESRGKHSSGFYNHNIGFHPNSRLKKAVGETTKALLPSMQPTLTNLLIGHTRQATMPNANEASCAHPFMFGTTVGAHNGIVNNYKEIIKKYELEETINVDSEVIFAAIEKAKDPMEVLRNLEGKFAVIFTNTDDTNFTTYVARNKERPLFRGKLRENGKIGMYMSSLKESLEVIGCTDIQEFVEDYLYEITNGVISKTTKIVYPPKVIALPVVTNYTNYRWLKSSTIVHEGIISFIKTLYSDGSIDQIQSGKPITLSQKSKETIEEREGKRYFRQYYDYISYTEVFIGNVEKEKTVETIKTEDCSITVDQLGDLYQIYANLETSKSELSQEAAFHGFNVDSIITNMSESIDMLTSILYQEDLEEEEETTKEK